MAPPSPRRNYGGLMPCQQEGDEVPTPDVGTELLTGEMPGLVNAPPGEARTSQGDSGALRAREAEGSPTRKTSAQPTDRGAGDDVWEGVSLRLCSC